MNNLNVPKGLMPARIVRAACTSDSVFTNCKVTNFV